MNWQALIAATIAVTLIVFPIAFIWYLNIGGLYAAATKGARAKRTIRARRMDRTAEVEN